MADDGTDRAAHEEQTQGEPPPPATAAALASAQRLVSAAQRFGRDDGEDADDQGEEQDPPEDPAATDIIPWQQWDEPRGRRRRRRAPAARGEPVQAAAPVPAGPDASPALASTLTPELLLRPRHRVPAAGWRRTVYRSSLGLVRVPPGGPERRRLELIARARTPVSAGHHRVAVLSMKGGVGKTTTTVALGLTLAALRGDRIIALDASPDRGTLADKLTVQAHSSVRDMLDHRAAIERYSDVRGFTSQTASRLEVLTSDQSPAAAAAFGEDDYCSACAVLERFYSVCLTDCGTGMMHSAMAGVLRMADQVILVTTPSVDSARSGGATIDWLAAHGHHDLARGAVVVLNAVGSRGRRRIDHELLEAHFAARCRAVIKVPYDPYLGQGAAVELDQLAKETARAYLELASVIGDGFARRRPDLELAR